MDVQGLTSAVVKHALDQHEDSEWGIVVDGMRRDDIGSVIRKAGATTKRQALRAVKAYLDSLRVLIPA